MSDAGSQFSTNPETNSPEMTGTDEKGTHVVKRFLKWVLVLYTLVAILLGFFQRQLLYHPKRAQSLPVAADQVIVKRFPASKDVQLTCDDGSKIGAWLLRKSDSEPVRPVVLYFHGNAQNRSTRGPWYELIDHVGADVFAIDYHGYGDSEGKMTEGAMYRSCDAAWNYLTTELGYSPEQIVIVGTSLGGAAAVYTAWQQRDADTQPAGLLITASFSSMVDVAGSLYPWLPVSAILIDRYPSDERIADVRCPVAILHGAEDTLVYQSHGKKLFDVAAEESHNGIAKRWVSIEGVGHNGLVRLAGKTIQKELETLIPKVAAKQ